MKFCKTAVVLFFTILTMQTIGYAAKRTEGYGAAINFIDYLFIKKEKHSALSLVSPGASKQISEPGSANDILKTMDISQLDIKIQEIMVFNRDILLTKIVELGSVYDGVKKSWRGKYPSFISQHLTDSAVCSIVVYSTKIAEKKEKLSITLYIFDDTGEGYKLVNMTDII